MNTKSLRSVFYREFPFFMAVPAFVWQILFLYIPLFLVLIVSFIQSHDNGFTVTYKHYAALLENVYGWVLLRSLVLATCNALLCVVWAYPVAYALAFYAKRFKTQLIFFLMLPFWISFLVQIYAWLFVLEKNGLVNSLLIKLGVISSPLTLLYNPWAIFLVMLYCYLPFAVMPIYSILEKFDIRFFEASADLGATQWQTFTRVTLPLSAQGIRTAFFLVYVPSFGEFVIPSLLGGGKTMYVGSLISHQFLIARDFHVGAAFTIVTGLVLLVTCFFWHRAFNRFFGTSGKVQ